MQNARLNVSQAEINIAGKSNSLRYADHTTLMAEREEELKSFSMRVKEQSEKAGLKLNIQKTKIIPSGPITPWKQKGKKWEQRQTLFPWAPKSLQIDTVAMKLTDVCSLEENL